MQLEQARHERHKDCCLHGLATAVAIIVATEELEKIWRKVTQKVYNHLYVCCGMWCWQFLLPCSETETATAIK